MSNIYFIGYKLHKDKSHTGIACKSLEDFNNTIAELKKDGYSYQTFDTEESLNAFVMEIDYSDKRKLSQQERWNEWALGRDKVNAI
jgi:hypothetical protein